jgi:Zn ribbon nucleic-acid-binding protein
MIKKRISFCPVCKRIAYFEIERAINLFCCSICGHHGKGTLSIDTLVQLDHQVKIKHNSFKKTV